MVRPIKQRLVKFEPNVTYFKPRGIPLSTLEEVNLTVDEIETLRLKDIEDLDQKECAKKMKISTSTFQRILNSAHRKIAQALIGGRAIRIEGGVIKIMKQGMRKFRCEKCKNEWQEPFGTGKTGLEMVCPKCKSKLVHRIDYKGRGFGRRWWGYKKKR